VTWELKNGIYLKDGCYLERISSQQIDADSYRLANLILNDNIQRYIENPPLLIPLMRGGSRPFLNVSGSIRRLLSNAQKDVDYVPVKVSRYATSAINQEGEVMADSNDIAQAMYAMESHDDGLIIDDVFDKGITCERVKNHLAKDGKRIQVATIYRKPDQRKSGIDADYFVKDFYVREIDGQTCPCWLVFPWEIDDHEPELWKSLYPEFGDLHPEVAVSP